MFGGGDSAALGYGGGAVGNSASAAKAYECATGAHVFGGPAEVFIGSNEGGARDALLDGKETGYRGLGEDQGNGHASEAFTGVNGAEGQGSSRNAVTWTL